MARFSFIVVASLLILGAYAANDDSVKEDFEFFMGKYNKVYASETDQAYRFKVFKANMLKNERPTQGITQFSDLTELEFRTMYAGRAGVDDVKAPEEWDGECTACKRFPELKLNETAGFSFDWRQHGAVTSVKNQGRCGSCWSFGTCGDIEGTYFLAGNPLNSLSEQELVSCNTQTDGGCQGGLQSHAFEWVIQNGGIASYSSYPYTSGNGNDGQCHKSEENSDAAKISSWYRVSSSASGEAHMQQVLSQVGPITIGINAGPMQSYTGGIDDPKNCNPNNLDHAVLIVGYGEENGTKYWIIKNSWGTSFGENGYYRIVYGSNKCGLANAAVHSRV